MENINFAEQDSKYSKILKCSKGKPIINLIGNIKCIYLSIYIIIILYNI